LGNKVKKKHLYIWLFGIFELYLHLTIKLKFYKQVQNFYFRNRTIKAKEEIGKYGIISRIWHDKFAPSNRIGNVTNLFMKLKPKDEKDFCDKYFQYAEEHKDLPISQRGLTYSEFVELVKNYMESANKANGIEFTYETYFNDALCHIITETYDGKIIELRFRRFLESLGYECDFFEGSIDAKYGVDIKVTRKSEGKTFAVQIKPISFIKSRRNDVHDARVELIYKYHNFLKDYKLKTYYAFYFKDKDTGNIFWLKNGDGFRFKLEELFSYDETNIDKTAKVKQIKDDFHYLDF
jgi:hypothetical protein